MKRFIRYLYEYEQGKRIRNVGFVKVETGNEETFLNVQAKGFQEGDDRKLGLYLFYEENGKIISIFKEGTTIVSPAFSCCMKYTKEDVGVPENYERINGLLLVTESDRCIAATWDDKVADVNNRKEFVPASVEDEEDEQTEKVSPDLDKMEQEEEKEGHITKIQRQDISRLPRCEWGLANNPFLIHGFNNYHYLVLIDDEKGLKLGVPGIYHIKEEKYAEMFGFGEFLEENEMFGYWCRPVKRRSGERH